MDFSDILFFVFLVIFSLLPKERKQRRLRKTFVPEPVQEGEVNADVDRVRRKMEALRRKRAGVEATSIRQNTAKTVSKEVSLKNPIEVKLPDTIVSKIPAAPLMQALGDSAWNVGPSPVFPPVACSSAAKPHTKPARSRLKTWMLGKVILEQPKFKGDYYGSLVGR